MSARRASEGTRQAGNPQPGWELRLIPENRTTNDFSVGMPLPQAVPGWVVREFLCLSGSGLGRSNPEPFCVIALGIGQPKETS